MERLPRMPPLLTAVGPWQSMAELRVAVAMDYEMLTGRGLDSEAAHIAIGAAIATRRREPLPPDEAVRIVKSLLADQPRPILGH
jgi:hypothetical protein